jgi:putative flippase GtrA
VRKLAIKFWGRSEIRFIFVGLFNNGLSYAEIVALDFFLPYQIAFTIATVLAAVQNFLMHKFITFRTKGDKKDFVKEFIKFAVTVIFLYFFGLLFLFILIEVLHIPNWLAFLINTVVGAAISFIIQKFIVFRNK